MEKSHQQLFSQITSTDLPKIFGLGRNYQLEENIPEPFIFSKPFSSITTKSENEYDRPINYELELGVMIGKNGKDIKKENYLDYIGGYFLCQDITDEKTLIKLKGRGASWTMCKYQDNFLPIGQFIPKELIPDPHKLRLKFLINGQQIFDHSTGKMVFDIGQQIEYISSFIELKKGDLILTGTPKWGPAQPNDCLDGYLLDEQGKQISRLTYTIKQKAQPKL